MRGLVIGKFMPVHLGHVALIQFAALQCDELIVSMSYTDQDPIDPQLRFNWLKEIFKDSKGIEVNIVKDDFDDDTLPFDKRTKLWADFIRRVYGKIDVVVSSEEYGHPFANNLSAKHISFDPPRTKVPVSATLIRTKSFTYWDYIPEVVRPYFVKKICFYGPESTGKTVMARKMAALFETVYVPEVVRELTIENVFTQEDIENIGKAQTQRVLDLTRVANKFLFCDTDLITTQIYAEHYLKTIPPLLFELEKQVKYEHYFLLDIDVPWVPDPLRDLGDRREYMFKIFKSELDKRKIPYTIVQGTYKEREDLISSQLQKLASML